jgi:uncharacterized membrane protein
MIACKFGRHRRSIVDRYETWWPDKKVVGVYRDGNGVAHGFLWSALQFEDIDVLAATATRAFGINSHGIVVGSYADANNRVHGFVAVKRRMKD